MSAITGMFYRNGRLTDQSQIKKMNDVLSHRGPDGANIWCEGFVAMGHQMLWTTPESLHEKLPFEDENLVITADARIDNRKELSAELAIPNIEEVSDSYYILKAYQRWGEECPKKLLGDFAFVIWDKNQEILFCARDHMGIKPFYYYMSDQAFFFATEIKALLSLPEVPCKLNEENVANYIMVLSENREITFYQKVLRLPAAHKLVVSARNNFISKYWELNPNKKIIMNSNEEYAKAFLNLFEDAIQCRLRAAFPLGFELSGGLDSSSVTCTARKIMAKKINKNVRLETFSATFENTPECDEQQYINAVIESGGFNSNLIKADVLSPLLLKDNVFWYLDEPRASPNLYVNWNIHQSASKKGVRIILNGFDGDTTVSHGERCAIEYFFSMKWIKSMRVVYSRSRRINRNFFEILLLTFILPLTPPFILKIFKTLRKNKFFNEESLIDKEFTIKTKIMNKSDLFNEKIRLTRTSRNYHYLSLNSGGIQSVLEVLDKSAAAGNLEPRYPFFDRRLVEFCLALPVEQKLNDGWDRVVMRRAMEHILPKKIQWRPKKGNLGPNFQKNLLLFEKDLIEELIFDEGHLIKDYINLQVLYEMYNKYSSRKFGEASKIFMVINLISWLKWSNIKESKS